MFAKVHNLVLIFLFLVVKAPLCWGFSVSRTDQYLATAAKLKLHENIKWLKLGHYEKKLFGYESSFRGPLFIHPEGFQSPDLELKESIRALFTEDYKTLTDYKRHPQCQFLARRNWLIQQLHVAPEDILPCEERVNWKAQLSATSVAFVFASADLSNPASSFGHTFIKLINPNNAKNKDLIDYGVNYAANANESDFMYAARGLFGLYGGVYTMLPYHQKIREYINIEGRDLVEYQMAFTADETDELINHLLELEQSFSPYHFLSTNCSYQLLSLFEVVRPDLNLSDQFFWWVIPIDTVKTVFENSNLITNRKHKVSLKTDYLDSYSQLGFIQKKALDNVVENLYLNNNYGLSLIEKGEVLDTALKYFAVRAYSTGEDLDQKKYDLALLRAELGQLPENLFLKKEFIPELSHHSSAIYLGRGQINELGYTSLKFRSAFHDLEQIDMGMVPMSLNNVVTFEARYFDDTKKTVLDRFTVLSLINTTPVTQLDQNVSWKSRLDLRDQWRPDIEYGVGYSFELGFFERTRLTQLISARYAKELDRHAYQLGPEILITTRPLKKLGLSLDLTYFTEYQNKPYLRFTTKMNYEIKRNYDIQLQANDLKDYQLSFLKNFIF